MPATRTGIRAVVIPVIALICLLAAWELIVKVFTINAIVLPPPTAIALAFAENWRVLLKETGITMLESVFGFILGSGIAYLLAVAFVHSRTTEQAVYPYAVALKSTPLIAIAPLLVLWFGNGILSKVVMSALVAFFPVLVNAVNGLKAVDEELLDLMHSLSASRWQILTKIRFQASLGYTFAALKIASSLAVVGAVIGEFTGSTQGIGHLINTSSYYLEIPLMFAGIVMISLGGILFFGFVNWLERLIVF